jgi:hypothetical protein
MRASRPLTATVAFVGVALLAGNPACSSSGNSTFVVDAGTDATTVPDATTPGVDGGTTGNGDAKQDSPGMLGQPDTGVMQEASVSNEGGFNDAAPPVEAAACIPDAGPAGPGPVQHNCIIFPAGGPDSENECDGHHDATGFPPNGSNGNGFDDNCNGLVDEGCACENVGTTKDCYLVPASQTVNGVPVGWCAQNSKGTVACAQHGEGSPQWSGTCRGAQPPYANDVCAPGDFNCDGKDANPNGESCSCNGGIIECPTAPLVTVPYPDPSNLPLNVNAAAWFVNPADVASATNWSWTLTGGDCDNILPHPTFGMYVSANGTGNPIGTLSTTLGMSGKEHGVVAGAPLITSSLYPAFSLSGDYVLTGSWTLNGTPYSCSVKIQARAPGIRAEGCWDTEGQGDDLDLHMAKVNFPACPTSHTWSNLATACSSNNEDCFYADCYSGSLGNSNSVDWGYAPSPASACTGWGSQSSGATSCGNPRLDRDANGLSGTCDATLANPNAGGGLFGSPFCGPENINVDHPANNDRFAVGLRFFAQNTTPPVNVHAHVNVYCDGARVLSAGYDPVAGTTFPQLGTSGGDSSGDMWKVALITTQVTGAGLNCNVVPAQSTVPSATLDGTTAYCVDDSTTNGATSQSLLTSSGLEPANANALCYH